MQNPKEMNGLTGFQSRIETILCKSISKDGADLPLLCSLCLLAHAQVYCGSGFLGCHLSTSFKPSSTEKPCPMEQQPSYFIISLGEARGGLLDLPSARQTAATLTMKIEGASVVLALAFFCFFSDVASQASIKNECMKIWSLLRSGKFSCHTNRQPIRGPDGRRDLNKCLMCQRLLERYSRNKGSGEEANRNVNSGEDECREFRDLFKNGKLSCTRENDPVRDSSGKQHSNKCIMCAEKFKRENEQKATSTRGKQKDDCSEYRSQFEAGGRLSCTRENDPVRDSSGKQHTNKCLMCAEKFKKEAQRGGQSGGTAQRNKLSTAECANQKSCSGSGLQQGVNERRPFSTNGGPQGNLAQDCSPASGRQGQSGGTNTYQPLDCDRILHGVKGGRIFCSESSQPVCGTDGKTYKNECDLCSAAMRASVYITVNYRGECRKTIPEMK